MKNKIVTVFGGNGFVGQSIVQQLAKAGARVRVAVRNTDKANHLRVYGDVGQIVPIQVSLADKVSIRAVCQGADMVINVMGRLYEQGPSTFDIAHVKAPLRIGKACSKYGVARLIHVSALGADATSSSLYAKTKGKGEEKAKKAFPGVTILRPSVIFGPDDHFFNRIAGLASFLPMLPLFESGHTKVQPVYVEDVAAAVMACLTDDKTKGKIYELGGDKVYTLKDLVVLTLTYIHRKKPLVPVPSFVASLLAFFCQYLPNPLITPDQLQLLKIPNVVSKSSKTLKTLGVDATPLEAIVPTYLTHYQPRF
jgi:NADH dehydrogenase